MNKLPSKIKNIRRVRFLKFANALLTSTLISSCAVSPDGAISLSLGKQGRIDRANAQYKEIIAKNSSENIAYRKDAMKYDEPLIAYNLSVLNVGNAYEDSGSSLFGAYSGTYKDYTINCRFKLDGNSKANEYIQGTKYKISVSIVAKFGSDVDGDTLGIKVKGNERYAQKHFEVTLDNPTESVVRQEDVKVAIAESGHMLGIGQQSAAITSAPEFYLIINSITVLDENTN